MRFNLTHEIEILKSFRLFVRDLTEPDDRAAGRGIIAALAVSIDSIDVLGGQVQTTVQRFNESDTIEQRHEALNELEELRRLLVAANREREATAEQVQDFVRKVCRR
ncbi:hypothetical protein SH467x_001242 [Pirellulaceae bacterium SH467]